MNRRNQIRPASLCVIVAACLLAVAACSPEPTAENTNSSQEDVAYAAPADFKGTPVWQDRILLSWASPDADVQGYTLSRRVKGDDVWREIARPSGTATEFEDIVATSVPYDYQLIALYKDDASEAIVLSGITALSSSPTNLAGIFADAGTVSLTWTDGAYETELRIERAGVGETFTSLGTLPADTVAFVDNSVNTASAYTYRVFASNGVDEAAGKSVEVGVPPAAPSGFTAAAVRADTIRLTWDAPEHSGVEHHVYRRAAGSGEYALIASVAGGETQYDDAVMPLTAYDYRIVAFSSHGESPAADALQAETVANQAVSLTVSGLPDVVFNHHSFSFDVTAIDADIGDEVSVRWLNPMADCTPTTFSPRRGETSARVTCRFMGNQRNRRYLSFIAHDDYAPENVTRATVTLEVDGASFERTGTWTGDVTGDGIDDLVTLSGAGTDVNMLHVWAGAAVTETPTATLRLNELTAGTFWSWGDRVVLADVSGDGVLDVVTGQESLLTVWKGGPSLVGEPAPLATLVGADILHDVTRSQQEGLRVGDVTGDGVEDILAVVFMDGFANTAILVWEGGAGLTGTVQNVATLEVQLPKSFLLSDIDNDGKKDAIVRVAGDIHVWMGGSLSGSLPPDAVLSASANFRDSLLGDMTGDGVRDIIAIAPDELPMGAVYVFSGANLSGTPAPTATLTVPGATVKLGESFHYSTLYIEDVTGDDVLDLILASPYEDDGAHVDAGAVYVFAGGSSLAGSVSPTATLRSGADSPAGVKLGEINPYGGAGILTAESYAPSILFGDVIGDSKTDIVIPAPKMDHGVVLVWSGGDSLTGAPAPTTALSKVETHLYPLGMPQKGDTGVVLADVTGDERPDIIAVAAEYEFDPASILVWAGATSIAYTPTAKLNYPTKWPERLAVGDLTGDGIADIIGNETLWIGGETMQGLPSPAATLPNIRLTGKTGQRYIFADVVGDGSPDFVGLLNGKIRVVDGSSYANSVTLEADFLEVGSSDLGNLSAGGDTIPNPTGLRLGDYKGNGRSQVIAITPNADIDGFTDAGAVYFWDTPLSQSGLTGPTATFAAPFTTSQHLGESAW